MLQLAEYMQRDADAKSRVVSALIYPLIVMGMSVVTVVVLATFVLPRFRVFFASLNAKLPLPTRMLLAATRYCLRRTTSFIFGGFLFLGAFGIVELAIEDRSSSRDAVMLKLPLLGDMMQHAILERICRILSSMLSAGVSLPEAMLVTADATNNAVYKRGLDDIRDEMLEGQGLAAPLARSGAVPNCGPTDLQGRRGDRNSRRAVASCRRFLRPRTRYQNQAVYESFPSRRSSSLWVSLSDSWLLPWFLRCMASTSRYL